MIKITLRLIIFRKTWLLFSLRLNLITHLKLKFLQKMNSQPLTNVSVILKISLGNVQLIFIHWNLMPMVKSLQKMVHCMLIRQILTISLLTLQELHVKILLQWWQNLFMVQLNPTLCFHILCGILRKKTILQKILHLIFHKHHSEKKWCREQTCLRNKPV